MPIEPICSIDMDMIRHKSDADWINAFNLFGEVDDEERYGGAIEALDEAGKTGSAEALAEALGKNDTEFLDDDGNTEFADLHGRATVSPVMSAE